jgi:hypothetical protein
VYCHRHKDSLSDYLYMSYLSTYLPAHLCIQRNIHPHIHPSILSIHLDTDSVDHSFCDANSHDLVNKFCSFNGTSRSITRVTTVHHQTLYWATLIQSTQYHHTHLRSILWWLHLGLLRPRGTFPSGFEKRFSYKLQTFLLLGICFPFLFSEAFLRNLMEFDLSFV